jgi:hypothetical protein
MPVFYSPNRVGVAYQAKTNLLSELPRTPNSRTSTKFVKRKCNFRESDAGELLRPSLPEH